MCALSARPPSRIPATPAPAPQDLALALVARLVDPRRPPAAWPLLDLARHLAALVNQTELGQQLRFEGGWSGLG